MDNLKRMEQEAISNGMQQRTAEWFEKRKHMITASVAASFLTKAPNFKQAYLKEYGLDELIRSKARVYESAAQVIKLKTGEKAAKLPNRAMIWGIQNECVAKHIVSKHLWPSPVLNPGLLSHREYPWLGCSVDGVHEKSGVIVEIKCPFRYDPFPVDESNGVPRLQYWIQAQIQLEILDLSNAIILQCHFLKYDTLYDFLNDTSESVWKGAFIPASDDSEAIIFEQDQVEKIDLSFIESQKVQLLCLDYAIVYFVKRNREWFNDNLPYLMQGHENLILWKENGQEALENARICLLNATATGSETLKNLVLPGVGSVTIIDDQQVTEADLGSNFFVDTVGESRAEQVCKLLNELNQDVDCRFLNESFENLVDNEPDYFKQFTLVIASQISLLKLKKLSELLFDNQIPLVIVKSAGFVGHLRIQIPEIDLIETHSQNQPDLFINRPFQELQEYANSTDLSKLDSLQFSHVPFVVILIKSVQEWLKTRNMLPKTSQEKNEFKKMIQDLKSNRLADDENIQEALQNSYKAWTEPQIPSSLLELFSKKPGIKTEFWTLVEALEIFIKETGRLPVNGSIPDMKADTSAFVQLQGIYHQKANQDIDRMQSILERSNLSVSRSKVATFCKNCSNLQVIRYSTLKSELEKTILESLIETSDVGYILYVLIRAADLFEQDFSRVLGAHDFENDLVLFKRLLSQWLIGLGCKSKISDDYVHEL